MQKKLLLIVLYLSSLTTKTDLPNIQCNDKHTQLLEKQIQLLEEQKSQQADILQFMALQLQLKTALLQEKKEKEEIKIQAAQAQADKPWYEKTWDTITPVIQNAIINFVLSALASKIINGGISLVDQATGDWLAQNGYSQYALYAGTFIAANSWSQYSQTRQNKIILSDPEVRAYNEMLARLKSNHASDIAKGEIVHEGLNLVNLVKLGKKVDEHSKDTSSTEVNTPDKSNNNSMNNRPKTNNSLQLFQQQGSSDLLPALNKSESNPKVRHENGIIIRDITDQEGRIPGKN